MGESGSRLSPDEVAAVIVTRGDVSLNQILASLPYSELIIWNDREHGSKGCYGRYLAAQEVGKHAVYFQDDDVVFSAQDRLLAKFDWTRMAVNMPSPWYEQTGYDRLQQALVGAGSVMPKNIWQPAIDRYLAEWPEDQLFYDYCDVIVGMLTPHTRYDFGYEVLPWASDPGRIFTTPGAQERKEEMQRRAVKLRDGG